jgi:myo-inositol-1-phosphate synthase
MPEVRVGLVGVGNNSCALAQGVHYYGTPEGRRSAESHGDSIIFDQLCGYAIDSLVMSCAFDVDRRKIGHDLNGAIFTEPNCYPRCTHLPPESGVTVSPAPALDGVPDFLRGAIEVDDDGDRDIEGSLERCRAVVRDSATDVLLNFLPSGSVEASEFFAAVAAEAPCAFVNATAVPIANASVMCKRFEANGVPVLGDDLESQFGSSLLHRTVLQALAQRGFDLRHSYQVNLGGNTDFRNLTSRAETKRRSKFRALGENSYGEERIEIVPSGGWLRGLEDHKIGYIAVEGLGWLGRSVVIDLKLKVNDSSNAAGVAVDLVRLAKGAMDHGVAGAIPLSYYFKDPVAEKLPTAEALAEVHRLSVAWGDPEAVPREEAAGQARDGTAPSP